MTKRIYASQQRKDLESSSPFIQMYTPEATQLAVNDLLKKPQQYSRKTFARLTEMLNAQMGEKDEINFVEENKIYFYERARTFTYILTTERDALNRRTIRGIKAELESMELFADAQIGLEDLMQAPCTILAPQRTGTLDNAIWEKYGLQIGARQWLYCMQGDLWGVWETRPNFYDKMYINRLTFFTLHPKNFPKEYTFVVDRHNKIRIKNFGPKSLTFRPVLAPDKQRKTGGDVDLWWAISGARLVHTTDEINLT